MSAWNDAGGVPLKIAQPKKQTPCVSESKGEDREGRGYREGPLPTGFGGNANPIECCECIFIKELALPEAS